MTTADTITDALIQIIVLVNTGQPKQYRNKIKAEVNKLLTAIKTP